MWPLIAAGLTAYSAYSASKSAEKTNQQNVDNQQQANQFSAEQAQKQMDFQERMSSTAHVREVADLKNAGLNPILSANAGASTPGGAMGDVKAAMRENPKKDLPQNLINSARLAADLNLTKELTMTQRTQQDLNKANEKLAIANSAKTVSQTGPLNWITRGLNAIDRTTASASRYLGRRTASINFAPNWKG